MLIALGAAPAVVGSGRASIGASDWSGRASIGASDSAGRASIGADEWGGIPKVAGDLWASAVAGVTDVWALISEAQAVPSREIVLGTAIVAALAVLLPGVWPRARHLVTIAHEGGHGLVAVMVGRRLTGIRLHSDTSGLTISRGRRGGLGSALVLLAGYPAGALLGLAAAALVAAGYPLAALWGALLLLALLLLQIRNLFGLWIVLVVAAALFAVTWWADASVQQAVAYALTWFLLLAAPRTVLELQAARRRQRLRTGGGGSSDADQLAALTKVPGLAWVFVFLAITVGCAVLGGWWLLGPVMPPTL